MQRKRRKQRIFGVVTLIEGFLVPLRCCKPHDIALKNPLLPPLPLHSRF